MKLKEQLHGITALIVLFLNTTLAFIPIFFIGLLKLIPNLRWKIFCTKLIDRVTLLWHDVNNAYINNNPIQWTISGIEDLSRKNSYLVIANHQSWLDIVILHRLFNRRIPALKFFIKDQLKWIPLLGFTWWAMGCPFMKRYSKEHLAQHPHKKGKDLEAVRNAVELFKDVPATVMNFVEGTRYTSLKQKQQSSPYQHLLKPKTGGIGFVLSAMGQQFNSLLDVTIIYANQRHSLWDFLCHRLDTIQIHVRQLAIPPQFTNSSLIEDDKIQAEFRNWLNAHWHTKDQLIASVNLE